MNFKQKRWLHQGLLIGGILLISFNLRPSLAAVGPLVGAIRTATGFSSALLGLLTTLPLLAFGLVSMFTSLFTRRWGMEVTLAGSLLLLTLGIIMRVFPSNVMLFGGTLLLGTGIAFGNVLLPSLIKRDFPQKTGLMTSLYSAVLGLGATVAAAFSIPLARPFGWRWALGLWALPVILALLLWLPQLKYKTRPRHSRRFLVALKQLGSSLLAWQVAIFMGLQSMIFYIILAWLPEVLQSRGLTASHAGWLLSLSQAMGIIGSMVIPLWAERLKGQHTVVWLLTGIETVSLIGFLLPSTPFAALWAALIGFSLGANFGLALLFIVLRTATAETATELSGLAQSIGYLLAATGPILFGLLHDMSGTWTIPLISLFGVILLKCLSGLGASTPKQVH